MSLSGITRHNFGIIGLYKGCIICQNICHDPVVKVSEENECALNCFIKLSLTWIGLTGGRREYWICVTSSKSGRKKTLDILSFGIFLRLALIKFRIVSWIYLDFTVYSLQILIFYETDLTPWVIFPKPAKKKLATAN